MTSHPGFDRTTNASRVAASFGSSIRGRVFLITGVSANGIGGATAKALATESPKLLILTGRSPNRVEPVISEIQSSYPNVPCRFLKLDLASQSSVRKAAAEVATYDDNIDTLINNAGVANLPERTFSEQGVELNFATNHLGHFLFTNLLIPKLAAAAKSSKPGSVRVINLASSAHRYGPVRFSDINFDKPKDALPEKEQPNYELLSQWGPIDKAYIFMAAYAQSKTANILFTTSCNQNQRFRGIPSFAVNPGVVNTDVLRHLSPEVRRAAEQRLANLWQTLEQGASTTLVAALDPALKVEDGRSYLSNCQLTEAEAWATDVSAAEKLWAMSEEMIGESFT